MTDAQDPFAERPATPGDDDAAKQQSDDTPTAQQPRLGNGPDEPRPNAAPDEGETPGAGSQDAPAGSTGQGLSPDAGDVASEPRPTGTAPEHTTAFAMGPSNPAGPGPQGAGTPPPPAGPQPGDAPPVGTPPPPPVGRAPGSRRGRKVAAVIGIVLLAGAAGVGGAALYSEFSDSPSSGVSSGETSLDNASSSDLPAGAVEQVANKVMPSVVQINFTGAGGDGGSGSGIVLSEDGKILTNNHVVEAAADGGTLTVAFNDGTNTDATIVGTDPATDVAIIQAEGVSDLEPASFGKSGDVKVGQEVVAIGSPFGLESTVTQGIVSALNRPVSPGEESTESETPTTFPAIQTDAAINPGNSGGPLVDGDGNFIGVNSAAASLSQAGEGGQSGSIGIGFAIPSSQAVMIADQLISSGKALHPFLGITLTDGQINSGGATQGSAKVQSVQSGSPADKAGFKDGDDIVAVGGTKVNNAIALRALVRAQPTNTPVDFTVVRGGQEQTLKTTLVLK